VIKGFLEADSFRAAAQRQLTELGIGGRATLLLRRGSGALEGGRGGGEPLVRRTLRVRDKQIVGYALAVTDLDANDSLRLQEVGIGGRRRFGCGVFLPWPR
jgi:CRISPR-associated protein Cas6